jgi:predicted CopG family antitoxin
MSTKTIAVESQVYDRLARAKREGESFSKTIDRLLRQVGAAHTGRDILRAVEQVPPLPAEDAAVMLVVGEENRASETWERHDLR